MHRDWVPHAAESLGTDLLPGADVDVVADAHTLSSTFGGERFANTPIDVLGPHILRLLRRAERGESLDTSTEPDERVTIYTWLKNRADVRYGRDRSLPS